VNDLNENFILQFNTNCLVDFSKISCATSETNSFSNFASTNQTITCRSSFNLNSKSEIFLVWSETNSSISKNSTVYRVYSQYLSYLNGTPAGVSGKNVQVKMKLSKSISKEIHQHLFCSLTNGIANYSVSAFDNKEDEISCIVPASFNINVNSGNNVDLKYLYSNQLFSISKSPLYIVTFHESMIIF
jgi:hypothetical protein